VNRMRIVALLAGAGILHVALFGASVARAQQEKRLSPHEAVTASIGGVKLTVEYGRPFKKKREIFGGLVPYDKVWRTGADEATTLTTDGELTLGDLKVPKGRYALFTVPGKNKWQLILSKNAKQWGAFSYDAHDDLGKTALTVGAAKSPVEQLTIVVVPTGDHAGVLSITWDQTTASAAITTR
jgi:Protein of unknown function (DUF2911)